MVECLIQSIASSSNGNCYRLNCDTSLLLEAGISYKQMQRAIAFETSKLAGVLVTHEHGDHAKYAKEYLKHGLSLYMTQGTADALRLEHHNLHIIKAKEPFKVGNWTIVAFDVQHDVNEPVGYLLSHSNGYKVLFITDTYYCKYKFKGITHMLLEVNYVDEMLDNATSHDFLKKRVRRSHMSLNTALEFLKNSDLSKLEEIHCIHLSNAHSDEELIKHTIKQLTGVPVYIAPE